MSGISFGAARSRRRDWHRWWRRPVAASRRSSAAPQFSIHPFTPTHVDKEEQRRWVTREIDDLPEDAVDEAHPHVLDDSIDHRNSQWQARVRRELSDYLGRLKQMRDRAHATVLHQQHLKAAHDHRVAEAENARAAAKRRLLGEDDEAMWHQAEHSDPSLLTVRSGASMFYLVALALAAVADFAAFYQVMERVLRDLGDVWVIILVIGFTAMALRLAHYIGLFLRDRQAGARSNHPILLPACAALWIALGVMAFWVRWKVQGSVSAPVLPSSGGAVPVPQGNFQATLPGAAMFAAFYFATGAAAITGSYLSHNPLHRAFRRTVRAHESAIKQQATAARDVADAEAERDAFNHQEAAAAEIRDSTIDELNRLADELKKLARRQLVKRFNDASAADAVL